MSVPTTITGDLIYDGAAAVQIHGGFRLGNDVTASGFSIFGESISGSPLDEIDLNNNKLTISHEVPTQSAINIPITGSGSVEYVDTSIHLGAVNTYGGTTSFVGSAASNTTTPLGSRNPSQMFGTSSLFIDGSSTVTLGFGASGSFTNTITLSDTTSNTTASGVNFNPQLNIKEEGTASNLNISLPAIILDGSGGIAVASDIATIDLDGIEDNGHCLHVETVYQDKYLNAPIFCGAGNTTHDPGSSVDSVPGVPNTGVSSGKLPAPVWVALSGAALAGIYMVARRMNLMRR